MSSEQKAVNSGPMRSPSRESWKAAHGQEAIELARIEDPNLILMD